MPRLSPLRSCCCCCGSPSTSAEPRCCRARAPSSSTCPAPVQHPSTTRLRLARPHFVRSVPWGIPIRGGRALPVSLCGCSASLCEADPPTASLHHFTVVSAAAPAAISSVSPLLSAPSALPVLRCVALPLVLAPSRRPVATSAPACQAALWHRERATSKSRYFRLLRPASGFLDLCRRRLPLEKVPTPDSAFRAPTHST